MSYRFLLLFLLALTHHFFSQNMQLAGDDHNKVTIKCTDDRKIFISKKTANNYKTLEICFNDDMARTSKSISLPFDSTTIKLLFSLNHCNISTLLGKSSEQQLKSLYGLSDFLESPYNEPIASMLFKSLECDLHLKPDNQNYLERLTKTLPNSLYNEWKNNLQKQKDLYIDNDRLILVGHCLSQCLGIGYLTQTVNTKNLKFLDLSKNSLSKAEIEYLVSNLPSLKKIGLWKNPPLHILKENDIQAMIDNKLTVFVSPPSNSILNYFARYSWSDVYEGEEKEQAHLMVCSVEHQMCRKWEEDLLYKQPMSIRKFLIPFTKERNNVLTQSVAHACHFATWSIALGIMNHTYNNYSQKSNLLLPLTTAAITTSFSYLFSKNLPNIFLKKEAPFFISMPTAIADQKFPLDNVIDLKNQNLVTSSALLNALYEHPAYKQHRMILDISDNKLSTLPLRELTQLLPETKEIIADNNSIEFLNGSDLDSLPQKTTLSLLNNSLKEITGHFYNAPEDCTIKISQPKKSSVFLEKALEPSFLQRWKSFNIVIGPEGGLKYLYSHSGLIFLGSFLFYNSFFRTSLFKQYVLAPYLGFSPYTQGTIIDLAAQTIYKENIGTLLQDIVIDCHQDPLRLSFIFSLGSVLPYLFGCLYLGCTRRTYNFTIGTPFKPSKIVVDKDS